MLFTTLFSKGTSKQDVKKRNLKGKFSRFNSFKYKLYKQRFINHVMRCQCRHCMPDKQVNIRLRAGIMLFILDVFIWLVVYSNLGVLTAEASVTIVNENATVTSQPVEKHAQKEEVRVVAEVPVVEKPKDIKTMIAAAFEKAPRTSLSVSYTESRHQPWKESDLDRMKDGRAFSVGLFQVNLTWHKIGDLDCPSAFRGKDYKAVVVNEQLYKDCVNAAKDPELNIEAAKRIYTSSGDSFGRWTTFTSGDYKKFLHLF